MPGKSCSIVGKFLERTSKGGYQYLMEGHEAFGLEARLANGGSVIVAEGFLFELMHRGYLQAGGFVPEVCIRHPDKVKSLTEEYIHAGSDVALAFTFYGNREKMRLIGKEDELKLLNQKALQIAGEVARETGTLFAGNFANSTAWDPNCAESKEKVESMFKEQIEWAVEAGVDYIVAETFSEIEEAMLGLECIKKYGKGVPGVVTLCPPGPGTTREGMPLDVACKKLEDAGAAVVGLNCWRGPSTILPFMPKIRKACKGPIACLPVTFQTTKECPTMQSLINPVSGKQAFPEDISAHATGRTEIRKFAESCKDIGVEYIGLCCGNQAHLMREVAEVYGRRPPASKYKADMSKHWVFGDKKKFKDYTTSMRDECFKMT